jgi:hypothetical protein
MDPRGSNADRLPRAAMLLSFDIAAEAQIEHDDWHSHEHLPERLAIPGFLRGSRWTALAGDPKYFVLYEVGTLEVLSSPAYMDRLNDPSPWTAKMMPSYRGMRRGLCEIVARAGHGLGGYALLLRFSVGPAAQPALWQWGAGLLPALAAQPGLAGSALFRSGVQAAVTAEQRIRGRDTGIDGALLATGYARSRVETLATGALANAELKRRGATDVASTLYQLAHCVTSGDIVAPA